VIVVSKFSDDVWAWLHRSFLAVPFAYYMHFSVPVVVLSTSFDHSFAIRAVAMLVRLGQVHTGTHFHFRGESSSTDHGVCWLEP